MSFYGTILYAVHLLVRLCLLLRHWFHAAWAALVAARGRYEVGNEFGLVQRLIQQLQSRRRLPAHIALVLQEELCYTDLGALVVWCMAAGISIITLYDHQGILKKNIEVLRKCVASSQQQLLGKSFSNYVIKDCCKSNGYKTNGYAKHGEGQDNTFNINVLSQSDGRGDIVRAARKVAATVGTQQERSSSNVDCKQLEDLFISNHKMPSPDLLVTFGPSYSVLGFLPWHLHLTEILHVRTHHHIQFTTFHKSLLRFAACEQRFGK